MRRVTWFGRLLGLCAIAGLAVASCSGDEGEPTGRFEQAASVVPSGFTEELVASGLNGVTAMAFAPDGRLFVTEQVGNLRVIKNGALLTQPFVTVSTVNTGERGLLGVAFDPNFASNGFVYLYYTTTSGGAHNRVSRFTASGDRAVAGSELVLVELDALSSATNHNGGALNFGPDGKLYIAVGENANGSNAQTLNNRLGKMLRINSDGSIPSDNPFFTTASGANRAIWALGLRNPFTFTFQPGTGRMFINDVGESSWEEINDGAAGINYGWPTTEGATTDSRFRTPVYAYRHSGGNLNGCSIVGAAFYNPSTPQFPAAYTGRYFFSDLCGGWITWFDPSTGVAQGFSSGYVNAVDLEVGPDGMLYVLQRGGPTGTVSRIRATSNEAPSIVTQPQSRTVAVGQQATFSVSATGSQPLTYQWQRNGSNISGATSNSYTLTAAAADNGATFRAVVTNGFGTVTSSSATLTVSTNAAPVGSITSPGADARYNAGDTISYAGTATDAEDGTLPASAYTWEIVFHHDTHTHPAFGPTSGATSGTFTIPREGELSPNVWYRIHLRVRDSAGLVTETTRDITPRTSRITLQTNPPNLQVTLDGMPTTTPATILSVVGMTRALGVVSPQTQGQSNYSFSSWSDGGTAVHSINTAATDSTYTASYTASTTSSGLRAEYFDNMDFTASRLVRTDPLVHFDWGFNSPASAVGAETFSVRWSGSLTPRFSEAYTLYATSDDGIRVTLNGVRVIDDFGDHSPRETPGTTAPLVAGQAYPILVEYFENAGTAYASLAWSSASQPKQVIPASQYVTGAPSGSGGSGGTGGTGGSGGTGSSGSSGSGGSGSASSGGSGGSGGSGSAGGSSGSAGSGGSGGSFTFPIKINFQASGPVPAGYFADFGNVFGLRNGYSYGWSVNHTDVCRTRNVNSDPRWDTLCHIHQGGRWEIALPNGQYSVLVSIGDPGWGSTHTLLVEGVSYWNALSLASDQFALKTLTVTVSDGRLTLSAGNAAEMVTRINYLEIVRL